MAAAKSSPVTTEPFSKVVFFNAVALVFVKVQPFLKAKLLQLAPSVIVPFFSPMDIPVQLSPSVT